MIRNFIHSLVALTMVLAAFVTVQPVAAEATLQCSDHTLNVTLASDTTDTYQVVGTLCSQGPVAGKTIQLLLHGATYARYYWDFPYQSEHYSYVHSATKRGYATFNLDRIGNGASDRPDGNLVTVEANGFVVHQVVQALRAGQIGSVSFGKVIVVGHSMGSFTALEYAGSFPGEADGVILTGFTNDLNWAVASQVLGQGIHSANYDPKFLGMYPNNDYLTTVPGWRDDAFYYMPNADPAVVALDEDLKQTASSGEFAGLTIVYDPISFNIEGPVQIVVGQYDSLFCGNLVNCSDRAAVQSYEDGWFGSRACVETAVINDAGHDLNLHLNANAAYSQMLMWADRYVGNAADSAQQPCGAN